VEQLRALIGVIKHPGPNYFAGSNRLGVYHY